jgi:hypothetical protein
LATRTEAAVAQWKADANAAIEEQADPDRLAGIRGRAEEAANLVNSALHFLTVSQGQLTEVDNDLKALVEEIHLPEKPEEPQPEPTEDAEPLVEIARFENEDGEESDPVRDYVEATDRLKAHKGYGKGEAVENGDDENGDDEDGDDEDDDDDD